VAGGRPDRGAAGRGDCPVFPFDFREADREAVLPAGEGTRAAADPRRGCRASAHPNTTRYRARARRIAYPYDRSALGPEFLREPFELAERRRALLEVNEMHADRRSEKKRSALRVVGVFFCAEDLEFQTTGGGSG